MGFDAESTSRRNLYLIVTAHVTAGTLKRVQALATGAAAPERFDEIPVAAAR
jgi:hypothetical protein